MGHRSECQSLWSIRSTSPSQIHHLPCSKKSLAPTGQRTATAKSRRSTKCTKLFWSQFWSYKWLLENTGMLFWYFLSSMSVMFHENLRCLGQCCKTMQNANIETWCGATALSIRTSPDEPEKTSCARQNWEVEESERKVLNMSRNVTKCHQFISNSYPIQSLYVRASSTTRITRRRLSETSLTTALRRSSKDAQQRWRMA